MPPAIFHTVLSLICLAMASPPDGPRVGSPAPEMTILTSGNLPMKLSSLRGKWVLVQFGATWNPDSEALACVFSNVRAALDSMPFEYIQVFDDPSVTDAEQFGFTQIAGISSVLDGSGSNASYDAKEQSDWFLIDPTGVVRSEGSDMSPQAIRQTLMNAWKDDPSMNSVTLTASPVQSLVEEMVLVDVRGNPRRTQDLAEQILAIESANETALRFILRSLLHTLGYTEAVKIMRAKIAGQEISDPTRIYFDICRFTASDNRETRAALMAWCKKYPDSKFLECISLLFRRLPDEITPDERVLITEAWQHPRSRDIRLFRGFVHQWDGDPSKAERYFMTQKSSEGKGRNNMNRLALLDHLAREGKKTEARDIVLQRKDLSPDNADPTEAWQLMFVNFTLQDWEKASAFAKAYEKLRPEKAQGILMGSLIARCAGDPTRKPDPRSVVPDMMEHSPRYAVAGGCLKNQTTPDVAALIGIEDLNVRFDTALLFVLLEMEKGKAPAESLRVAQNSFSPGKWPYDVFNQLRHLHSQRPAADLPPIEEIASPTPAYARGREVATETLRLLKTRDTAGLERLADHLRKSRESLDSGGWVLSTFYDNATELPDDEAGAQEAMDFYERWAMERPDNITAQVCFANALTRHAWKADTNTEEGARLFQERIARAQNVLNLAKQLNEKCPAWFEVAQIVALGQRWDRADFMKLVDEAIRQEPTYGRYYGNACRWLLPRCCGKPGDFEKWIAGQADTYPPEERDRQYARLVFRAGLIVTDGDLVFSPGRLDWERTKRGFDFWLNEQPDNLVVRFEYTRLALLANDRATARAQFESTSPSCLNAISLSNDPPHDADP